MRPVLSCSVFLLSTIIIGTILPSEALTPLEEIIENYCISKGYGNADSSEESSDPSGMPMCQNPTEPVNVTEQFQKFGFIPQIIDRAPSQLLITYISTYRIGVGNYIPPLAMGYRPRISYVGQPGTLYTLVILNVDTNFVFNRTYDELVLVYLVVNIPGSDTTRGDILVEYQPVLPTPGVGAQRYVTLLYVQKKRITANLDMKFGAATTCNNYVFKKFVKQNNLGDPLAGNFYLTSLSECTSESTVVC